MRILTKHPNAIIGGLLGAGGVGQAVIYLLNAEGVQLSQRQSGLIAAAAATSVLAAGHALKYLYRHGIVGVWSVVLHGKTGPGPAASATETGPAAETLAAEQEAHAAQLATATARIAELEQALTAAGVAVPGS